MQSCPSPIPAPIFDSDESDSASQQSNDSSAYLSSQFSQHARLSFSPKLVFTTTNQVLPFTSIQFEDFMNSQDDSLSLESTPSEILNYTTKKRKRSCEKSKVISLHTPNQSPYTRRRNLDYVQETAFQSPKIQRRSRHHDDSITLPSSTFSNLVNINPFHLQTRPLQHRYHTRLVAKRQSPLSSSSLQKLTIQRFEHEFRQESFLGSGEFSHVYLCTNRLDGLNYAIKTSKQALIGTSYEEIAWREICAYALLTSHENLVRYYSAWIENDGRFFIQLEYCNGGSLEDVIDSNRREEGFIDEQELKNILHQLTDVLAFMHSKDLAHLDVKPSNIILSQYTNQETVYKLTDLGHVSQISSGTVNEDGDSRYLALEIIGKCDSTKLKLDKCDLFSLGLTLYVCATNYRMPKQGNEWQQLRLNPSQYLYPIPHCSKGLNELLVERMCHVDPDQRPSAHELLLDSTINPLVPTSRESLRHSLKQERDKNISLNKKLLDQYLLTTASDLQILPIYTNDINPSQQDFLSPTASFLVPQHQQNLYLSNDTSRLLASHSPTYLNPSIPSPTHCGSFAMTQQVKLAGSNMFRYYSSII